MPSPSTSLATQRPDLAASFEEFSLEADRQGFIGHRVLPVIEVAQQAGNFGKIPLEELLRDAETRRAPRSGYNRDDYKFETATYACEEHGFEQPVDDRLRKMYANYFDAEMIATKRAYDRVLRNAEKRIADLLFNATTFTPQSITNEWDDSANAVPLTDVETAVKAAWAASGLWPNALIINRKVFRNLRNCTQIIDRVKYQGFVDARAGNITAEALAQAFDLDMVLVAGGSRNTAKQGQSASISQIWSDEYAMVCRIASTNDFEEPCIGRTFHWSGDGSEVDGHVESYRDEVKRADIVRVRHDVDEVVLHTACAKLLDNVTT
ncbi:MAG: hypothetical protein DWQ31_16620 [Planctomycetota bacterium]|nr:MAG: hypothetical protein DWQ31_16620 [Planctomycetota bacterium]